MKQVKLISLTIVMLCAHAVSATPDSTLHAGMTNSFTQGLSVHFPGLHYKYDDLSQTHNYSGNWDFDGDGKMDSVLFVGNGGAHLYYHLKIVLSRRHDVREYPWIESDFPLLQSDVPSAALLFGWSIKKSAIGRGMELVIHLDGQVVVPEIWRKRGIHTGDVEVFILPGHTEMMMRRHGSMSE